MNKWSIYQVIVVITLVISAIIFNQLDVDLHYQIGDSMGMVTSQLLVMIGFLFISGLMCLIFLFQTKKSQTFLQSPAWKKNVTNYICLVHHIVHCSHHCF